MSSQRDGLKVAEFWGIPIFIHWSFPIGGLVISAYAGFDLWKAFYYSIAYVLLIAIHEFGHVLAARMLKLKVFSIHISGIGGKCFLEKADSLRGVAMVYSGGLFAQMLLFAITFTYAKVFGLPDAVIGRCLIITFTIVNVFIFLVNIIPYKSPNGLGTDGYMLWRLLLHVVKGHPHPMLNPQGSSLVFEPETSLLSIEELRPSGFSTGIEILNDNTTPMEFVVFMLTKHLGIKQDEAISLMLEIHTRGGLLIPLRLDKAIEVSVDIAEDVKTAGHQLVCRAVDARE
ncbi:MAG: ATP-dependent Clp protease adaptor ClpS [Candidatus Thiodiazotropha sp. (ex Monitilora ramsayi)]|nr:ATP-dependent Clp protease adaptor ClpS [Candidatus Thiodiazotropha sp. (ex Monitilora ramsayi)]